MKKRILSLFCVLALCLGLLPATASAAGGEMTQYTHYLALGDRTCAVYPSYHSTSSYVFPYPARIAKEKGYILTTSANTGETSESLLARLAEEETQIKKSTVVSVTIGNTDLLYALRDYLMETYNAAHDSTLTADEVLDKMGKVDTDFLADMQDASVGSGFVNSEIYKKTAAELEANLREILETIQGYNPDAYLMVFNLYNPYCKLAAEDGDPRITPYAAGIPDAYDNGATALNTIIAQVCSGNSAIHLVDVYTACSSISTEDSGQDFALRLNLSNASDPSALYPGVQAFYPKASAHGAIRDAAPNLDLPEGNGWPVDSDYYHPPQADWPGIIMASTSHGWWDIDEDTGALYNIWGASINNNQAAIVRWNNTLNLMGEWLAPGNLSDGCDGPFLNQDRFWKTTEADGKKVLDFDSGSETYFEDYNVWLDEENAILHLQDAQLETDTTCLTTNADVSDIFTDTNTLTIQLTGSSSFRSTVSATITTDGHEGDLCFTGNGSLEVHNTSSVADSSIHMDGDLSIADGAQVTVYAVSAGPKQTAVQAKNVTIEDGGTLAIDLAAGSKAQPFDTGTDGTVTVKEGGALKVTVGSNLQADLSMLDKDSDLSRSTFRVDGLLVLPDDLTTEGLPNIFSGSGLVELNGTFYAIAADGSLTTPDEENVVNGDIAVTTGTPVTEEDNKGYTWGQDEETKNWVLTLKTSMVTGDISITQDCKGENFDPNDEDAVPDPSVVGEDIVVRLVADKPCTVYGKITCEPTVPYIGAPIRHTYLAGTLAISGAGLTADTVEYQYGAVQLSGVLDARGISAWRTRLLEDADLTLSEGISLTVNNMLTGILYDVRDNEDILNAYTDETVKDLVMERIGGTFVMENGARYSCTGTAGTPIQVELYFSILAGISTEKYTAPEYESQRFQVNLTQEDLENVIQIPYDLPSTASLVFSYENENLDDELYSIATGCFTLQSEGALELPVPNRPGSSGGGSSSSSDSTITDITQNPDGSVTTTETNETTGTVTETTKYPDGSEKVVETQEDGTVTTTTTDADGSKEVVETKKDGTVTTTTTDTAGNQTQVVQNPDGSSKTTVENTDGSGSVTVVDENGKVVSEAKLSQSAIAAAQEAGETVALPMPQVPVTTDRESAPTVTVDLPAGDSLKVEIPVENVTAGTVAILVKEDGTEEVIKTSVTTDNGVTVTLSDGDTVKIVDNSKTFVDVPAAYWGAAAVDSAASRELFAGTSETTFSPDTAMTRSMIVTVLARFEGVDTSIGDIWYEAGRQWAMENGISDGTNMDASLTREQLAAMLYRYAKEKGYDTTQGGMAIREYDDFEQISGYAVEAMTWAVNTGLISGTTTTTLSPRSEATRAQVASILMRFIEGME